jgi:hypothetical protein
LPLILWEPNRSSSHLKLSNKAMDHKKYFFLHLYLICLLQTFAQTTTVVEQGKGSSTPRVNMPVILIDFQSDGRIFDGVGAISAGASSRLLYDYPEPERSQILDYLFLPNYGASLQILKVEIGGDMDATSGAEPSHMRTPDDLDCGRGYEWWLMKEAKARNPKIKLYALEWGAPGWFEDGYWSADNSDYILAWLRCARSNGLTIDYLGGGNEMGYDKRFYVLLKKALIDNGFEHIKVVASDNHHPPVYWKVATDMKCDPEFNDAIDIIGEHDVCHWRTPYYHCDVTEDALVTGKPLWNSEQSTEDYADWGPALARAMNRNYIDAKITANLNWGMVSGIYGTFRCAGTGLILCDKPWSGYYDLGKGVWVDAHTTQFVDPGWRYVDSGCGYLASGTSYVTLLSPDKDDYSIIIESMDATSREKVKFLVPENYSSKIVHVWQTNMFSDDPNYHFIYSHEIKPEEEEFILNIEPGYLYSLTTTDGQMKGKAKSIAKRTELWPLPYQEDFEEIRESRIAKYFSDVHGAFEVAPCGGDRQGNCYRQVISSEPIIWHKASMDPTTILGDPEWWGDYQVTTDVLLEGCGFVELIGRVESQMRHVSGYHFQVSAKNGWTLYTEDMEGKCTTLDSGLTSLRIGAWHQLELIFVKDQITASIDGRVVTTVRDDSHTTGQIGLRVGSWQHAQFDNVSVVQTADWPQFLQSDRISVKASSTHEEPYLGYLLSPHKIIDNRLESMWRSEWDPPASMPQSVTFDLGDHYSVKGIAYYPPLAMGKEGMIKTYNIYHSKDGVNFLKVTSGNWKLSTATKTAKWISEEKVRYIKLEIIEAEGKCAAVGELKILLGI